jgi:hypothetical protein
MFKSLHVGDLVYVRYMRPSQQNGYVSISRVGRRYGYFKLGDIEKPFSLQTGESIHLNDSNARANNFGFDVYPTKEIGESTAHLKESRALLAKRLTDLRFYEANFLSAEDVALMHEILDRLHSSLNRKK